MDHGFTVNHFALLAQMDGVARAAGDAQQDTAYARLVEANEATAVWARAVQMQLFPLGKVRKLSKPTDMGQKFKSYTWVRIYPRPEAPKALAYTVGIDASGEFCVKLDTVQINGSTTRRRYDELRGHNNYLSPFAAILPANLGLALSFEQLVAWTVEHIGTFDPGYDALAVELGLIKPELTLITDLAESRAAFARWYGALSGDGEAGGVQRVGDHRAWIKARNGTDGIEAKLGLDPTGAEWAVEINAPPRPGDHNRLSAIAADATGGLHLLRQGWLQGRRPAPDIREAEFMARTGLVPASVLATGRAAARRWFLVASLDDPPARIRKTTIDFVELCWAARTPIDGTDLDTWVDGDATVGGSEQGGCRTLPARPAVDPRIVERLHGRVWETLATLLARHVIGYRIWRRPPGYTIDMEIAVPGHTPLLVEIKTGTTIRDVQTGVGQLQLYRQLFPELRHHDAVLLIDADLPSRLQAAVAGLGIIVHRYQWDDSMGERQIVFSEEFRGLCGLPR
ncbi:hypothetical protein NFO65_22405 [Neorhizobium galegae]|uniref:hypothetical protein n=1 Tax=Neorhizobium galegae TaxID=399 RepID=UPI0021018CC6|nr:hypothetical protein [Neorhizobium galegae]MCQ1573482.1 hypothetical protein [Neorhizobium galegae]